MAQHGEGSQLTIISNASSSRFFCSYAAAFCEFAQLNSARCKHVSHAMLPELHPEHWQHSVYTVFTRQHTAGIRVNFSEGI